MSRAHRARRDIVEEEVICALEACGWATMKLAQRGVPDLVAWRPHNGMIVFVECKTGRSKLRVGTQTNWRAQGLPVLVFRSGEDVLAWHRQQTE